MNNDGIRILDCTLRDGGYINDWNFGKNIIQNIIINLVSANTDLIEVGFLRDCEYSENICCYNTIDEIRNNIPKDRRNSEFVAMVLYTEYDIKKLEECDGTVKYLRVTFHNYDINEGLEYCKKVQDKGYSLFINPINIMGYGDAELLSLVSQINDLHPYGFSIVDTFGSMTLADMNRIYSICENNLNKEIVIGLHLHENMSMGFSLAQEFLKLKAPERKCVIDGSLYGMGRRPGNLCIELIIDYLTRLYGKEYQLEPILDAIEEYIEPIHNETGWGYSIEYFLSAKNNIHRNYAEHFYKKKRLTAKAIEEVFENISDDKRGKFDADYADAIYIKYLDYHIEDNEIYEAFMKHFEGKYIILVAPGKSSIFAEEYINSIAEDKIVITANFTTEKYKTNYCFFSNMKRFEEYKQHIGDNTIITSNILRLGKFEYTTVLDYMGLARHKGKIVDSCGILLLRFLYRCGVKRAYLIGFDGFMEKGNNYYEGHFGEQQFGEKEAENLSIANEISSMRNNMNIVFVTKSVYENF